MLPWMTLSRVAGWAPGHSASAIRSSVAGCGREIANAHRTTRCLRSRALSFVLGVARRHAHGI